MKHLLTGVLLIYMPWTLLHSQNNALAQAFNQNEFTRCLNLCDSVLRHDSENAQAWFFKGSSLVSLEKYSDGKKALLKASQFNYANAAGLGARLLIAEAGLQDRQAVLNRLTGLTEEGFAILQVFDRKEFSFLEQDQKFQGLVHKVEINANPCKYKSEHQRLDFWLGEWDVFVGGNKTAVSSITKSEGGCTLHEDYRTQSGFFGTSYNYFDPQDSLYKQIWIDKFNSITNFHAIEYGEGFLVMLATRPNGNLSRMSYQSNDTDQSVTQTMEASTDGGKTWTSNFVGVYRKKSKT